MFLVTSLMIFSVALRIMYTYETAHLSMIVLDLSASLSQIILVLTSIRMSINQHSTKMKSFLKKLCKIDGMFFVKPQNYQALRRKLCIQCGVITMITSTFTIAETFLWSKLYTPLMCVITTYPVKYCVFYYKFIIYIQIQTKVNIIKERFESVNKILYCNSNEYKNQADSICMRKTTLELHSIFEAHDILCDMIDIVNDMHGFQIFLIICSIIVAILNLLNAGIILILLAMFIEDQANFEFQYGAVGIQGVLCFFFIVSLFC